MDISKLKELLAINSYSLNRAGVNQKNDFIQNWTRDLPLDWERIKPQNQTYGDLLVGRSQKVNPTKPMVGLLLHSDTVHKAEVEMTIVENEGKLFGQGAQDMQSSIFVAIKALKQLQHVGDLENIIVIINSAEEQGSPEFQQTFAKLVQELDYVLVYEASGNGDLEPTAASFHRDYHLVVQRKGIFGKSFRITGPGGHSGVLAQKHQRKNAISQAVQMIRDIDELADYEKGTLVNMEHITGGQPNTIIATECEFSFDCRYTYGEERERLKREIAKIATREYIPGVEVEDLDYNYDLPPFDPNENTMEFLRLVESVAEKLNIQVTPEKRGGWSDACNFYTYNPDLYVLDGFGPKGDGEHTQQEFVYLDSLEPAVELSTQVIKELNKLEKQ